MELKQAQIKDIIDLKKICIDAYSKNFYNHWNDGGLEWYLEKEFSLERLNSDMANENITYYFILNELKPVGFIKIKDHISSSIVNTVELEKIYILPKYKGMGIGKLALKDIMKKTQERGIKELFLYVIDTNTKAISFYEKLGFKFHSKTTLDLPYFKEELKGMHKMTKVLKLFQTT